MPITITTPATYTQLCTLDDMPMAARGTNSSNDTQLAAVITRASALIRRYCRRHFERQTYEERLPGYGGVNLLLMTEETSLGLRPGGPVMTIDSVLQLESDTATSGTAITRYVVRDRMAGTLYKQTGWDWTAQLRQDLGASVLVGSERLRFLVTYTAGFVLPNTTNAGTLPQDIRAACVEQVSELWNRSQRDTSISRIAIPGDVDITYRTEGSQSGGGSGTILTPGVRELLHPWRLEW